MPGCTFADLIRCGCVGLDLFLEFGVEVSLERLRVSKVPEGALVSGGEISRNSLRTTLLVEDLSSGREPFLW